ncbi:oligosaccharide repeat unit polymerase [Brevundimonas sp. GCM10030266]|uniref:oligosaccharide repeat unit polymerase n=1 Tax=Brevundimonas sp. GCM10030266 TaxID=3273386 RepID=UPI00361B6497
MRFHPAILMLMVWVACVAAFFILPFQLENRVMSIYGYLILFLFIGVFCLGAFIAGRPQVQQPRRTDLTLDFQLTDRLLIVAALIAVGAAFMDTADRNILNLAEAYRARSATAGALMSGDESQSSIWFQLSFLTYPAGFIYLVREIAYRPRPVLWKLGLYGLLPIVMAALSMGGRSPLLYALVVMIYAFNLRKQLFPKIPGQTVRRRRPLFKLGPAGKAAMGALGGVMFIYFMQVFLTRAEISGGVDAMFGIAGQSWGVNFNGPGSNVLFELLGPEGAYLTFVSFWYLLQGLVMSNTLFTSYDGPMQFGVYGIDLIGALMRRLNGEFVANGYAHLGAVNVYGFLPSAFGTLYVDLKFLGLIPCFIWGWLAGKVYALVKRGRDPRWLMAVPFIVMGILFSIIGTPIGFSNGLLIHLWLIAALITVRVRVAAPQSAHPPRRMTRRWV